MTTRPSPIPDDRLARYRETAERRRVEADEKARKRIERALAVAGQAAALLRRSFGTSSVTLFGSLAEGRWFGEHSDIDLAVAAISPEDYLLAVARLQDISPEFAVDLIDLDHCSPTLRESILRDGRPL